MTDKTEKLTITNVYDQPYGANTVSGTVHLAVGETKTLEFSEAEAKGIRGNPKVFKIGGEDGLNTTKISAEDQRAMADAKALMSNLAPIAYKLGANTPEELAPAIEKLIAENERLTAELAAKAGQSDAKPTLAEAVASLDDKNDAHWIQSGKPNLDALKDATGGEVSRADVDAIGRVRSTA